MRITRIVTAYKKPLCGSLTTLLLIMTLAQTHTALGAGLEIGAGGGNCAAVKQQISRDWIQRETVLSARQREPEAPEIKRLLLYIPCIHSRGDTAAFGVDFAEVLCDSRPTLLL